MRIEQYSNTRSEQSSPHDVYEHAWKAPKGMASSDWRKILHIPERNTSAAALANDDS